MDRFGSVLDYQHPTLDKSIWNVRENLLRSSVRSFIFSAVAGFFEELQLEGYESFVKDILIGSSLATYNYHDDTDLDIKIIIDTKEFKWHNPSFKNVPDEELMDTLLDAGRDSFWLTQVIPNTEHKLDPYFYTVDEIENMNLLKYDALYSVFDNEWIKQPKKLPEGVSTQVVLEYAKEKASNYLRNVERDIAKTRRDSIDFIMLYDYIKSLPREDIGKLYGEFQELLQKVNDDIAKLSGIRENLKEMRVRAYSKDELRSELEKLLGSFNYSDENLVFKLMQRYGYMRILSALSKLLADDGVVSPEEVLTIPDIIENR